MNLTILLIRLFEKELKRRKNLRIGKRSLKCFGHVLRMGEKSWSKLLYQWKPDDRRKRIRLKTTWIQNMVSEAQ